MIEDREMEDMEEDTYDESDEELQGDGPAAVHSLLMSSGKKINIELYFRKYQWKLSDAPPVTSLEELSFRFDEHGDDDSDFMDVQFILTMEGRESVKSEIFMGDGGVRFRAGPLLRCILGENDVFSEGRRAWPIGEAEVIRIELEVVGMDCGMFDDAAKFAKSIGRVIRVEDGEIRLSIEFMALYSPFFAALFYGHFHERNQEVVSLKGVTLAEIKEAVDYCVTIDRKLAQDDLGTDAARAFFLVRFFDRFGFVGQLESLRSTLIGAVASITSENSLLFPLVPEVARMMKDPTILTPFLNRFCTMESLTDFIEKSDIDPDQAALIEEAADRITAAQRGRSELVVNLADGGTARVSLFDDLLRLSLDRFLNKMRRVRIRDFPEWKEMRKAQNLLFSASTKCLYESDNSFFLASAATFSGRKHSESRYPLGIALSGDFAEPQKVLSVSNNSPAE